jgi:hypothetical protein
MKKSVRALSLFVLGFVPMLAIAGAGGTTCATAQLINLSGTYSGDTSAPGYGNPIGGFGPLPSPSNDAIYTFTVKNSAAGNVVMVSAGYNYGIFLTTNCAGTTAPPIEAATGPAPGGGFPIDGLAKGQQYFVTVSGNPSDPSAPNGSYTFTIPMLDPVELQSFSIE